MSGKKQQFYIREYVDRPVSKKDFLREQEEQATGDGRTKQSLIRDLIFTDSEIRKMVQNGILKPIKYRSKIYFSKEDILVAINTPVQRTLIQ